MAKPDGEPVELYANVASPSTRSGSVLHYIDYEIDIVRNLRDESPPVWVDEDEFTLAIERYGLSDETVADVRRIGTVVVDLIADWQFDEAPHVLMRYLDDHMTRQKNWSTFDRVNQIPLTGQ